MKDRKEQEAGYRVSLTTEPDRVISDGRSEATFRCTVETAEGKPVGGEAEVVFTVGRTMFRETRNLRRGTAAVRFATRRPVERTRVKATTPYGEATAPFYVAPTLSQWIKAWVRWIAAALILVIFVIKPYILGNYFIPSGSMEPTFYRGDRLFALMFVYRFAPPRRGDIVIFRPPFDRVRRRVPLPFHPIVFYTPKEYIKRVIGVGGDAVEVRDGTVYINGVPIEEPYIESPPWYYMERVSVPEGSVFVLGDNRNNSRDSHIWGMLERKHVRGKAVLHFWPPDRFKLIRRPRWAIEADGRSAPKTPVSR
ncbi:MAG: signal peptidase I [bacterium]